MLWLQGWRNSNGLGRIWRYLQHLRHGVCNDRSGCDHGRRNGFGRLHDKSVFCGDGRLFGVTLTEQPLQQSRSFRLCRTFQLAQGLALQSAQLAEQ
ncbi:hypothetical protein D3C76_726500 [compost metagenome]